MNGARIVLEVPVLDDGRVRLRPWRVEDAPALVSAWNDPAIVAGARPPDDRSLRAARRWIEGCDIRRRAGVALDLVMTAAVDGAEADDAVLGEVGLARFDVSRRAAMAGWWVADAARGRGVASAGVRLLVDWVTGEGHLGAVLAEISPDNTASTRVAERAGFSLLRAGADGAADVWVRR